MYKTKSQSRVSTGQYEDKKQFSRRRLRLFGRMTLKGGFLNLEKQFLRTISGLSIYLKVSKYRKNKRKTFKYSLFLHNVRTSAHVHVYSVLNRVAGLSTQWYLHQLFLLRQQNDRSGKVPKTSFGIISRWKHLAIVLT